ncbi:glycosyltransferase family 4 protein [Rhodopirellula sp. JC639]|uniref:glycosyltransferase family 4 protein n=1 Tax=Stieleria mannarensis TaxID=2755585 RepID=UPI0016010484|nr:glycosyltransferase family 4 protein [Rhodopirellula sp. JC639]
MKTYRLLIVSRCSNPHGGADRIIADLCRNLPHHGWEVTLGLTKGASFNDPEGYRSVYPDLPIVEIDGTLGTRSSRLTAIKKVIDEVRPDVVLSMRVFDAYEVVAKEKQNRGIRLVVGVRAFEDDYLSDVKRYRDHIDGCVTSGKLVAEACCRFANLERQRVISIAGGVHAPECAVSRQPIVGRPVRLLYAGRIEKEQKRCQDLPLLLAELERRSIEFELDVAGTGPSESELRNQLSQFGDRHAIRFHGWVDRETLYRDQYRKADLFVHFAAWEGVTIAPREAMAHGCVPVISRFPGLVTEGQFVDETNCLTFPVGDPVAAAGCVERLVGEPELITRLSEQAKRSQSGCYSFDGSIVAWDAAFRSWLDAPMRSGVVPVINEKLPGRLTDLGVPASVQNTFRKWAGRPVRHRSPGSEWPTSSGLLTDDESRQIDQIRSEAIGTAT